MPKSRPSIDRHLSAPEPAARSPQSSTNYATKLLSNLGEARERSYVVSKESNREESEKPISDVESIRHVLEVDKQSEASDPRIVYSETEASIIHDEKKRLFVCCDSTWKNASGTVAPLTNVGILARCVDQIGHDPFGIRDDQPSDQPAPHNGGLNNSNEQLGLVRQVVYYSSGVGTQSSLCMDSGIAAATGHGIWFIYFKPNVKSNGNRRGHRKHTGRLLLHLQ